MSRREYLKAWNQAHKKEHNAYDIKWKRAHPESAAWHQMLQRCNNPNRSSYPRYGGRGVQVLYKSYEEFLADVGPRPSKEHSIDRIDNNGHYERGNCRWATRSEQQLNQNRRTIRQ